MVNIMTNKSRDKRKSILFIQLPLLDHGKNYISGNYLYAPCILTEYINKERNKDFNADWMPSVHVNFLSDDKLVSLINDINPDIVCFTVFLWNTERSLKVAELIKTSNNQILFGGAEIYPESFLFLKKRSEVDLFCSGEGEWFFSRYPDVGASETIIINDNRIAIQPLDSCVDVSEVYIPKAIDFTTLSSGRTLFVEMTRGCPYKCCYCNYSKNATKLRYQPIEIIIDLIEGTACETVYILAPSINTRIDFNDLLDMLITNSHKKKIHAEVNAAQIDKELAEKMFRAGFRSVEAGLQTLTLKARIMSGRTVTFDSELRGISNLLNAGISVRAGMIPGLPGDTVKEFIDGVNTVTEKGLSECIEIYPLMVLPGTELTEMYTDENIISQEYPPYFLLEKDEFNVESIKDIIKYTENKTGYVSLRRQMPDISSGGEGFIKGIYVDIDTIGIGDYSRIVDYIETSVFTIIVRTAFTDKANDAIRGMCSNGNFGDTLISLVIEHNGILDDSTAGAILQMTETDSILKRMNIFDPRESGSRFKIFQVFEEITDYSFARLIYRKIDAVVAVNDVNSEFLFRYISQEHYYPKVLIRQGVGKEDLSLLVDVYADKPDLIEFESLADKMYFCEKSGNQYLIDESQFRILRDFSDKG